MHTDQRQLTGKTRQNGIFDKTLTPRVHAHQRIPTHASQPSNAARPLLAVFVLLLAADQQEAQLVLG